MKSVYKLNKDIFCLCSVSDSYRLTLFFYGETTLVNTVGAKLKMAAKLKSQVTNAFKMHGLTLRR